MQRKRAEAVMHQLIWAPSFEVRLNAWYSPWRLHWVLVRNTTLHVSCNSSHDQVFMQTAETHADVATPKYAGLSGPCTEEMEKPRCGRESMQGVSREMTCRAVAFAHLHVSACIIG